MKNFILLATLMSTLPAIANAKGNESIHCEKKIFLSGSRDILDLTLENDVGQVFFGKLRKASDEVVPYDPNPIMVKKVYQDAKRIEIVSRNEDTQESEQFRFVLSFRGIIDSKTIEFRGDVDSPHKDIKNMSCTVSMAQDKIE